MTRRHAVAQHMDHGLDGFWPAFRRNTVGKRLHNAFYQNADEQVGVGIARRSAFDSTRNEADPVGMLKRGFAGKLGKTVDFGGSYGETP
jgi:hypothetical protein